MLPMRIMHESVIVTRPSYEGARGSIVPNWDDASTFSLSGVSVQERDGASDNQGRDAATAMATLYAQPGANIERGDRVEAHGRTWTVTGEPRQMGIGSKLQHVACNLQEWEG